MDRLATIHKTLRPISISSLSIYRNLSVFNCLKDDARVLSWKMMVLWLTMATAQNVASAQDHYCGVYSAFAVLDHYGQQVKFEQLLEPEYVPGYLGSTAKGIVAALKKNGVGANSYSGLGIFDLRIASGPAILHVRGSQGTRQYKHWVVYLGEQNEQAIVLDPSRGRSLVSYPRLLAMWDGVAVATAESSTELSVWRTLGLGTRWLRLVVCGCLIFPLSLFVETFDRLTSIRSPWFRTAVSGAILISVLSATALGLDMLNSDGLLRSAVARASITSVHAHDPFPEIELRETTRLHGESTTSRATVEWIDARYRRDYDDGHIPGAISLPIDARFQLEDDVVSLLSTESEIVVYCQSQGCAYAQAVSDRLRGHGFSRIRVFAAGYRDWEAPGESVEPKRPDGLESQDTGSSPDQIAGGSPG